MSVDPTAESLTDPEGLVARAVAGMLGQIAGAPTGGLPDADADADADAKVQPWAETAAPLGRGKRSLDELLAEYGQRVAAAPDAVVGIPPLKSAAVAFFDRLAKGGPREARIREVGTGGRSRRRGGRSRGASTGPVPPRTADLPPARDPVTAGHAGPRPTRSGGRRQGRPPRPANVEGTATAAGAPIVSGEATARPVAATGGPPVGEAGRRKRRNSNRRRGRGGRGPGAGPGVGSDGSARGGPPPAAE